MLVTCSRIITQHRRCMWAWRWDANHDQGIHKENIHTLRHGSIMACFLIKYGGIRKNGGCMCVHIFWCMCMCMHANACCRDEDKSHCHARFQIAQEYSFIFKNKHYLHFIVKNTKRQNNAVLSRNLKGGPTLKFMYDIT